MREIGHKLRSRRIELGLTQKDVAEITGIPQAEISKAERGLSNFSINTLLKIMKALKTEKIVINLPSG